jgi:hypothetical protein
MIGDPPADELAGKLQRTEVQHQPSSIPGREIVVVLTEIPCGVESGWHIHPGEEIGYLAGRTAKTALRATLTPHDGQAIALDLRALAIDLTQCRTISCRPRVAR